MVGKRIRGAIEECQTSSHTSLNQIFIIVLLIPLIFWGDQTAIVHRPFDLQIRYND